MRLLLPLAIVMRLHAYVVEVLLRKRWSHLVFKQLFDHFFSLTLHFILSAPRTDSVIKEKEKGLSFFQRQRVFIPSTLIRLNGAKILFLALWLQLFIRDCLRLCDVLCVPPLMEQGWIMMPSALGSRHSEPSCKMTTCSNSLKARAPHLVIRSLMEITFESRPKKKPFFYSSIDSKKWGLETQPFSKHP